jgi:hypothetical protein
MQPYVGIAVLVVAGALLVPVVPAAAETTVSDPDRNNVVTITVHIDCVGCRDWRAPGGGSVAKHWKKTAENAWNAAFDKWSYCNKYKFELEVDIKNRPADFEGEPGRHRIAGTAPSGDALAGTGWEGLPERTPGGDPGQRSPDGTRYFENDGDGFMPADATETVIVHEFGHVIGLGDDRDDAGNVVNGRTGSIMVGGAKGVTRDTKLRIDKALVKRIGDQLANLGKVTCGERWEGKSQGRTVQGSCSPIDHSGTMSLVVARDGTVTGTWTSTWSPYTCGPAQLPGGTGSDVVTGTKTDEAFTLDGSDFTVVLEVSGDRAKGKTDLTGFSETLTRLNIKLRCTDGCKESSG